MHLDLRNAHQCVLTTREWIYININNDCYKEKSVPNSVCFNIHPIQLYSPQQRSDGEADDEFAGCEHSFTAENGYEG